MTTASLIKKGTLVAVFTIVSYVVSWGLTIPHGLEYFQIIGVIATMAGSTIALFLLDHMKSKLALIGVALLVFCVSVFVLIFYQVRIEANPSGVWAVFSLGILFGLGFFCLGFAMGLAGIPITDSEDTGS